MNKDKEYLLTHTSSWEEDNASLPIQLLGNYFASHNSTIIHRLANVSASPLSASLSTSGAGETSEKNDILQNSTIVPRKTNGSAVLTSTTSKMISGKDNNTNKNNKPFNCTICNEQFNLKQILEAHIGIHINDYYRETAMTKKAKKSMLNDESDERSDNHEVCCESISESSTLMENFIVHNHQTPYKCELCGRTFSESGQLKRHSRTHKNEKTYSCDTCGKRFACKTGLVNHSRVHSGEKPYKCEVCGRGFSQSGNLKSHSRTHTNEKPYSCDTCGKAFARKTDLVNHSRVHSGEKPYKCELCDRSFSRSWSLKSHSITHTNEKPFSCDTCGKTFARKTDLTYHIRTHSGEKPYKCEVCGRGFSQSGSLKIHLRVSHLKSDSITHANEKP